MQLSKIIGFPLVLLFAIVLATSMGMGHREYSYLLIPMGIILASIYVFHQQIDQWYFSRNPVGLPQGMIRFIDDHLPTYRLLDPVQKHAFHAAVSTFLKNTRFIPQGFERTPEDLKVVVAANAHILTSFKNEWHEKIRTFETIVIYSHPFPSPQYPDFLHSSELYLQDRVLIFCADHFMKAFRHPDQYFNTAMYEWCRVLFLDEKPAFDLVLETLPEISGFEQEVLVQYLGFPEPYIDWEAVAATYFFTFPVRFKMYQEEAYEQYVQYFGVDPVALIGSSKYIPESPAES